MSHLIYLKDAFARPGRLPLLHLFSLHVLQTSLVETNLDDALENFIPITGQIAQFLQFDLVTLTLVQVGQCVLVVLRRDGSGSGQYVLEASFVGVVAAIDYCRGLFQLRRSHHPTTSVAVHLIVAVVLLQHLLEIHHRIGPQVIIGNGSNTRTSSRAVVHSICRLLDDLTNLRIILQTIDQIRWSIGLLWNLPSHCSISGAICRHQSMGAFAEHIGRCMGISLLLLLLLRDQALVLRRGRHLLLESAQAVVEQCIAAKERVE